MVRRMLLAIDWQYVEEHTLSFSLSIDATVSASVLDTSMSCKAIMAGTYPNNIISTVDMTKEQIKAVLDESKDAQIKIDKASEIKVVFMVFQQTPPGMPTVEIIAV
eukprot:2331516-Ditylum_brightwellii.AAC.1